MVFIRQIQFRHPVQGFRQLLISYPDFLVEDFQSCDNNRWKHLIHFYLIRIKGIEAIDRADIYLPVGSLQSSIRQELFALQTIATREDLTTLAGSVTNQPFRRGQPQHMLIFNYTADVTAGNIQRYRFKPVFPSVILAKPVHRPHPHISVTIYQHTIHLIVNQCTGSITVHVILPGLFIRIILKQTLPLRRKPDVTIGILIYINGQRFQVFDTDKIVFFTVIQVYSCHRSHPDPFLPVTEDGVRTGTVKGGQIAPFGGIYPERACFRIQHIDSSRIGTNP